MKRKIIVTVWVLILVILLLAVISAIWLNRYYIQNLITISDLYWNVGWIDMVVYGIFALTIIASLIVIPYILGSKGVLIYGHREGFCSILYKGVENGTFDRAIGSMKGFTIHPDGKITDNNKTGDREVQKSFSWIGIWPTHGVMRFDTEQTKLVNKDDGSLGLEKFQYSKTMYIPIRSTERLVIKELELSDLASKIDLDVTITYSMTHVYIAQIKNRGSIKILKANTMEGLRETVCEMSYQEVLKLKNATGPAVLKNLVEKLNAEASGFDSLTETTGYELVSINVVGVELSGGQSAKMSEAFASVLIAQKAAEVTEITAKAARIKKEEEGAGNAKAEGLMVDQLVRRINAQKGLSAGQALGLAIEKTKAQVVNVGSGSGSSPLINLDPSWEKADNKTEK